MIIEEIKQELNRAFGKYEFIEDDHYYLCNGKRVGISTTWLIHQYSQEFDSETIAQRVANKRRITPDEVLEEWRIENLHSTIKGSMIHQYAQSLWEQKEYIFDYSQVPQEIDLERLKSDIAKLIPQADNFYNDYKDMYTLIGCEMYLGDEEFDECGATDQLMLNNYTEEIAVWDYKSNKEIVYKTKYSQKMKVPLQKFDDVNYIHYSIQLCDYAYKIEKNANLKVGEKMLIHFDIMQDNYTIIEPLEMMEEAKKILEMRRVKNMNSVPVLIYGKSGTGKSTSLRNFKKDEVAVINVLNKPLPFRSDLKAVAIDDYATIIGAIKATKKKVVVIDDAGYLLSNEAIKRGKEVGYTKFTDMAMKFFTLIEEIRNLDGGKTVYIMLHEELDELGNAKLKLTGKMLDQQVCIEGCFTIALRAMCSDGKYIFRVHNNGQDITKSPFDMFEQDEVDNDLKEVDKVIREYYELDKVEVKKDKKEEEK